MRNFAMQDEGAGGASLPHMIDPVKTENGAGGEPERKQEAGKSGIFTQDEVDRIVKERLEREKLTRDKESSKAKENAEAEALKKNQEWQALAEKSAARVMELEPLSEQVERYRNALEKSLAAEKKDLPRHVLVLLEKLDPVDQIEYLSENREGLGKPLRTGVPASPEPKERKISDEDNERARQAQTRLYSGF